MGRIVHFYNAGADAAAAGAKVGPMAAIVVGVDSADPSLVDLAVFELRASVDLMSFESGRASIKLVRQVKEITGANVQGEHYWTWPPREGS